METGKKIKTFRERFVELFEESKTTTTKLAKELHVSNQTISAWKTGARSPKAPTIVAIADYFGVTIEWLMGFDVKKENIRPKFPVVIPDSPVFTKIMENMSAADYEMVVAAFDRTYKKMKEKGLIE